MNHSSNDFDNILRQQVEESAFEYSDAYWGKAAALLDAAEGKRKRKGAAWWLWRISGVLLLISTMVGGYLLLPISTEQRSDASFGQPVIVSSQSTDQDITGTNSTLHANIPSEVSTNGTSVNNASHTASNEQYYSAATSKMSMPLNGELAKGSASNIRSASNIPATGNGQFLTNPNDYTRLGSEPTVSLNNNIAPQNTQLGATSSPAPEIETRFPGEIPPMFPIKAGTLGIPFLPSENLSPAPPIKPSGKKLKHPVNGLFAGLNVSAPMGNRNDVGMGFYAGFQTGVSLGNKVSLVAQPGFALQNGVNLEAKTTKTTYDFDIRQVSKTIDYHRLYNLELPVVVQFHPNSKLTFQMGAGASYLFMANAQVNDNFVDLEMARTGTTTTANLRENKYENTTRNIETMECKGLSKVDVFVKAGVQYRVYKNLHVHVTAQKGFMDQTNNTFFANSASHTNMNARVGVSYLFD